MLVEAHCKRNLWNSFIMAKRSACPSALAGRSRRPSRGRICHGLLPPGFCWGLGAAFVSCRYGPGLGVEVALIAAHNGFCRLLIEGGRKVEGRAGLVAGIGLQAPGGGLMMDGIEFDADETAAEIPGGDEG